MTKYKLEEFKEWLKENCELLDEFMSSFLNNINSYKIVDGKLLKRSVWSGNPFINFTEVDEQLLLSQKFQTWKTEIDNRERERERERKIQKIICLKI